MAGNVWQWTSTIYDQSKFLYPYKNDDGRESNINTTSNHVLRGGSWSSSTSLLRSADRGEGSPDGQGSYIGFRCARSYSSIASATLASSVSASSTITAMLTPSTSANITVPTV